MKNSPPWQLLSNDSWWFYGSGIRYPSLLLENKENDEARSSCDGTDSFVTEIQQTNPPFKTLIPKHESRRKSFNKMPTIIPTNHLIKEITQVLHKAIFYLDSATKIIKQSINWIFKQISFKTFGTSLGINGQSKHKLHWACDSDIKLWYHEPLLNCFLG